MMNYCNSLQIRCIIKSCLTRSNYVDTALLYYKRHTSYYYSIYKSYVLTLNKVNMHHQRMVMCLKCGVAYKAYLLLNIRLKAAWTIEDCKTISLTEHMQHPLQSTYTYTYTYPREIYAQSFLLWRHHIWWP